MHPYIFLRSILSKRNVSFVREKKKKRTERGAKKKKGDARWHFTRPLDKDGKQHMFVYIHLILKRKHRRWSFKTKEEEEQQRKGKTRVEELVPKSQI